MKSQLLVTFKSNDFKQAVVFSNNVCTHRVLLGIVRTSLPASQLTTVILSSTINIVGLPTASSFEDTSQLSGGLSQAHCVVIISLRLLLSQVLSNEEVL